MVLSPPWFIGLALIVPLGSPVAGHSPVVAPSLPAVALPPQPDRAFRNDEREWLARTPEGLGALFSNGNPAR